MKFLVVKVEKDEAENERRRGEKNLEFFEKRRWKNEWIRFQTFFFFLKRNLKSQMTKMPVKRKDIIILR